MTNRIADLELRLTRENIDNYKLEKCEKMNPEDIEKYRKILEIHTDITGLEKLLAITRNQIMGSGIIGYVEAPSITATTEFGSLIKSDPNFINPQIQNKEKELHDKYLALTDIIQTNIDLIMKNPNNKYPSSIG